MSDSTADIARENCSPWWPVAPCSCCDKCPGRGGTAACLQWGRCGTHTPENPHRSAAWNHYLTEKQRVPPSPLTVLSQGRPSGRRKKKDSFFKSSIDRYKILKALWIGKPKRVAISTQLCEQEAQHRLPLMSLKGAAVAQWAKPLRLGSECHWFKSSLDNPQLPGHQNGWLPCKHIRALCTYRRCEFPAF